MKVYKHDSFFSSGESIHIFHTVDSVEIPPHTHEFIEIVYVRSGEVTHTVDGISFNAKRGDVIFVNYGSTHEFSSKEGHEYYNICFSPEVVSDSVITADNAFSLLSLTAFNEMSSASDGPVISFNGKERDEIENILEAMLAERKESREQCERVLECYISILFTKMLRRVSFPEDIETVDLWRSLADYIDENLDSRLTLSHLASKCFYNPSYFSRIFKEKFGQPLTEYITSRRINAAKELLLTSELSASEIGEKVGFSDKGSFYHAFSRSTGKTPAVYRAEKRDKRA